nr:hypothetical protein Iba_chr08dCG14460 [Ipomoea batatas]
MKDAVPVTAVVFHVCRAAVSDDIVVIQISLPATRHCLLSRLVAKACHFQPPLAFSRHRSFLYHINDCQRQNATSTAALPDLPTAMAVFQIWSSNMRSRYEPSEGLIRLSTQAPPRKHYSPQKIARNASHPSSDYQSAGGVYRRGRGRRQWRCKRSQGAPELETELLRKVFPGLPVFLA